MIFASERSMSASKAKSIVRYGLAQSPSTPRRWKSLLWPAICSLAYSRHLARKAAASSLSPTLPCFFSTASSIGNPWQSQPGT